MLVNSDLAREIENNHFRVVIFGSARLKPGSPYYNKIYELARLIGAEGMDVVTGGGPGLMDAAMSGHFAGKAGGRSHEIGLQIKLEKEQVDSRHFNVKQEFDRFSDRLDTFMTLANVAVVAPGGVGTLLEFSYTWQLIQVGHTCKVPIILLGPMWKDFVAWLKKWPLQEGLLDARDMDLLYLARENKQAMEVIRAAHKEYLKSGPGACLNVTRYRIR